MKRYLIAISAMLATLTAAATGTDSIGDILRQIAANNLTLKAQAHESEADVLDIKADNALGGPSVEYSPFFKKGYSGVALFTKQQPQSVTLGLGIDEHDHEGRVITADYGEFYLVTVYTPNAQDGLKRLDYRMAWEDAFRDYLCRLDKEKPVIVCGDMNVAHKEIDLKNPKTNRKNAGFSDEERGKMTELLSAGFTDTFRHFYPDLEGAYSWWSYRFHAREKNAGWRIDYFLVSNRFIDRVKSASILSEVFGSDHCPVMIEIE